MKIKIVLWTMMLAILIMLLVCFAIYLNSCSLDDVKYLFNKHVKNNNELYKTKINDVCCEYCLMGFI